jgi:hypothetical protein
MPHKTQFQRRRNFVKTKNLNEMEIEEKEESEEIPKKVIYLYYVILETEQTSCVLRRWIRN